MNILFKNPHLKICLLILEREEGWVGGERERVRERHQSVDFRYAPQLGLEPTTFWCMR